VLIIVISCTSGVKLNGKNLLLLNEYLGFYLQSVFIRNTYGVITGSGGYKLTDRRNQRGRSKDRCMREGRYFDSASDE
jgi:hypothetical protein